MFWLAWQLVGVIIVVVVIIVVLSIAWDVLRYILSPSERESMPGVPMAMLKLAIAITGMIVVFWLLKW
jgi:hypothetical protein